MEAEYQVVVSYDGCSEYRVDLPDARGSRNDCVTFIELHQPPKGSQFDIMQMETGRVISFMYMPAVKQRRLSMQDLVKMA